MGLFAEAKTTEQILAEAAQDAVRRSLITHPMRVLTTEEVKRRAMIAGRIAASLAYEADLSAFKVRDVLPEALAAALDGKDWQAPANRNTWMADAPGAAPAEGESK